MALIKFKRGPKERIPALQPGEPGFCLDTGELYIGTDSTPAGNKLIGGSGVTPQEELVIGCRVIASLTAPASPRENDLWFDLTMVQRNG